jgi:hypothetical protein
MADVLVLFPPERHCASEYAQKIGRLERGHRKEFLSEPVRVKKQIPLRGYQRKEIAF